MILFFVEAYIQTSRALMVTASILGLPAVALVLMSMSCINLGSEPESAKNKRSVLGGTIMLLTGKPIFISLKLILGSKTLIPFSILSIEDEYISHLH